MDEETITIPEITITTTDLSDDTWAQATYYTKRYNTNVDTNVYAKFLDSIKERDAKINASEISALSFLYKEGYITQEEYTDGKSERLNDIRTYGRANGGTFVVLFFDESEWNISVEVGSESNIISVVSTIDGEDKTLYQC